MHERIAIKDIAKIEGHASFVADIVRGDIRKARIKVEEGARFFEGMLRGRKIDEMPVVASRICGVCPIVHNLTASGGDDQNSRQSSEGKTARGEV